MPPIGDQAWVRMPCAGTEGLHVGLLEVGVQLDLVDRRNDLRASSSAVRWSTMKLLTFTLTTTVDLRAV